MFCAPSTADIVTASTKNTARNMKHIFDVVLVHIYNVVNCLVQKYNVIVPLTTKARGSSWSQMHSLLRRCDLQFSVRLIV